MNELWPYDNYAATAYDRGSYDDNGCYDRAFDDSGCYNWAFDDNGPCDDSGYYYRPCHGSHGLSDNDYLRVYSKYACKQSGEED